MRLYRQFISFTLPIATLWILCNPALCAQFGATAAAAGQSQDDAAIKYRQQDGARQAGLSALDPSTANISGTVTTVNGDLVPGATIVLEGADASDRRKMVAGDNGAFRFEDLKPGIPYRVTVGADGFQNWESPTVNLNPGQYLFLQDIKLSLPAVVASVTVSASPVEIATQQVTLEEHQRVLGVFPNFYVTYENDPAPLTTRLKFRLATRANTDAVTFLGVAFMAAIYQAGDIPDYGQGWDAYGKRVAAGYADTTTDIFIGGAILPSLLHQDPRYFYQGTGTTKSRAFHAMFSPFICRGDNGKPQPNYSSLMGDLSSGAISNFYYPESNRGAGLVFQGFAITTGVRMVNAVIQEFVLRKLTPSARERN
ncbi:MAG TPA: carboxypeptidase-like regulatory domain-containing protein [Terracidiphilus sp.]|nr:carboxypeptidase-like regulatory domain-containing protein [Terracidiphilus sp.]